MTPLEKMERTSNPSYTKHTPDGTRNSERGN